MANRRQSSEFIKALGALMEFWQAIIFAVFNLGGNDDDLRRVFRVEGIAEKIAALIMDESKQAQEKPQPDLSGLEVFHLEVDGDKNWLKEQFYPVECSGHARSGDFIHRPGKRRVRFALYPPNHFPEGSNEDVLADMKRRGLRQPSLAGTNTVLDARNKEFIVGICGVVQLRIDGGGAMIACVAEFDQGRALEFCSLGDGWGRDAQFLAEVSE